MLHLYSTLELLAVATSNSHFIFCFCNFIIAFLLIASNSKTASSTNDYDEAMIDRPSLLMNSNSNSVNANKEEEPIIDQSSAPADDCAEAAELKEEEPEPEAEQEQEDDDDDDEFKRRIEQFIDKINREWKAEKLRAGQYLIR